MRGTGQVQLLLRDSASQGADQAGTVGGRRRSVLAHRERVRPPADRHVPARGEGREDSGQDRPQDDEGDGHKLRHPPRDNYHRYNSYKGVVGEVFENVIGRDFEADGPWQKMGTDVTEFKQRWGKAYFAPVYDFGSKEIVAWSTSTSPNLAQQMNLLDQLVAKIPEGRAPILHSDMGWQYQHASWCGRLKDAGIVQSMSRKGNCIDNGATEQVFGHIKDEFFVGQEWPSFEAFKRDLDAYVIHWNTRRRQVKLKGLTPEEFRNQSLAA